MKNFLLSMLLFLAGTTGICTTWIITNSGFTFNPPTITISTGDNVNFTLASVHDALEVSKSTYDANGTTPLPGGFQTPLGGGIIPSSQLGVGTHYYVCSIHAADGMKGVIIVQSTTGIEKNMLPPGLSVYPNPSNNILTIEGSNNIIGSRYFITDQTGRQVFKDKITDEINLIDISQLKPGLYLIQLVGQRRQSVKVIKN